MQPYLVVFCNKLVIFDGLFLDGSGACRTGPYCEQGHRGLIHSPSAKDLRHSFQVKFPANQQRQSNTKIVHLSSAGGSVSDGWERAFITITQEPTELI